MPLFNANPIRSAAIAAVVVCVAHFGTMFLSSLHAFQLTQTSIAVLAMSALLFMIMMHHKAEGRFMDQTQEEMAVIGIFALLWVVLLVAYKSLRGGQGESGLSELGYASASQERSSWDDICSKGHCIYEEYTYF